MTSNGQPLKIILTMNKKEIAKQFTKQMIELEQSKQVMDGSQLTELVKEIQEFHSREQENYRRSFQTILRTQETAYKSLGSQLKNLHLQVADLEKLVGMVNQKAILNRQHQTWQTYLK